LTSDLTSKPYVLKEAEYDRLKGSVRALLGVDLDYYKSNQMIRRLSGFVERVRGASVAEFCGRLEREPELRRQLKDFLTINVTEFFRDTRQFETLERDVLPDLLRHSPALRVWSAGCSRGAEAYSLAILLKELKPGVKHQIVGTDLDGNVVNMARAGGPFSEADLRGVTALRRQKWFVESAQGTSVKPELQSMLQFREGDMLKDRFEAGFDLILCRNVVIYFSEEAKRMLYGKFQAALKEGGVLFIGGTETIFEPALVGLDRITSAFYRKGQRPAMRAAA
jgi:chemotaxis protein methyltransferase CheR